MDVGVSFSKAGWGSLTVILCLKSNVLICTGLFAVTVVWWGLWMIGEVSEWAVLKSASIWLGEWTNVRMAYEEVISIVLMCVWCVMHTDTHTNKQTHTPYLTTLLFWAGESLVFEHFICLTPSTAFVLLLSWMFTVDPFCGARHTTDFQPGHYSPFPCLLYLICRSPRQYICLFLLKVWYCEI